MKWSGKKRTLDGREWKERSDWREWGRGREGSGTRLPGKKGCKWWADMEVPTESLDKSLLEFNNLLSPANLLIMKPFPCNSSDVNSYLRSLSLPVPSLPFGSGPALSVLSFPAVSLLALSITLRALFGPFGRGIAFFYFIFFGEPGKRKRN